MTVAGEAAGGKIDPRYIAARRRDGIAPSLRRLSRGTPEFAMAEEATAASQTLAREGGQLKQLVEQFDVGVASTAAVAGRRGLRVVG